MKKLFIAALFVACGLAQRVFAGDAGHGFGFICITPTKCVTLAEAGLKIKPTSDGYYHLPPEQIAEVKNILNTSGLDSRVKLEIFRRVIATDRTYLLVETIDPKKMENLKKEYTQSVAKIDPGFDLSHLQMAAWSDRSSDGNTYLLPSFITPPGNKSPAEARRFQAEVLIHESNVRSEKPDVLENAITFDVLLTDLTSHKGRINEVDFDYPALAKTLGALNIDKRDFIFESALIRSLELQRGTPLKTDEFCAEGLKDSNNGRDWSYYCRNDYEKLVALADIDPRITRSFEKKSLWTSDKSILFGYDFANNPVFTFTNYTTEEKRYGSDLISEDQLAHYNKLCANSGATTNERVSLILGGEDIKGFSTSLVLVTCGMYESNTVRPIIIQTLDIAYGAPASAR